MRCYVYHAAVLDLVVVGCAAFAGVPREGAEDEAVVGCGEAELVGEVDRWEGYLFVERLCVFFVGWGFRNQGREGGG